MRRDDYRDHPARAAGDRSISTFCSIRHKIIFIHVPKCAGTTINTAILAAVSGGNPLPEFRLKGQGAHPFAMVVRDMIGMNEWQRCWKFGVVRNPWDRMVSLYAFLYERGDIQSHIGFRSWLLAKPKAHSRSRKKIVPQSRWLFDGDRQIVDSIFRFECLDEIVEALSTHLGQPIVFDWYKKSERGGHRDYYDGKTRAWIERVYVEDIERFDYGF